MAIREQQGLEVSASRFDAEHTAESIRELEEQYAAGEIEPPAYLMKKHALVRLYLKATTTPKRHIREEDYGG